MNTIIEKIRAEVERKRDQNREGENSYYDVNDIKNAGICRHRRILCEELLAKLSDLEKEEKPTTAEGLEEEIERYLHSLGVGYGGWVDGMEDDDLRGIARHFYELGRQSKPINQDEDFRGEMREWVELMVAASFPEQDNDFISEEDYRSVIKQTARHFAKWGAEHLKK